MKKNVFPVPCKMCVKIQTWTAARWTLTEPEWRKWQRPSAFVISFNRPVLSSGLLLCCFAFSFVVSWAIVVWSSSILEQPEGSTAAAEAGVLVVPEISVTHVSGERPGSGEKGRALGDTDAQQHVQGVQETATDPRSESRGLPELRRQKSVRKMMEDGMSAAGRVQF